MTATAPDDNFDYQKFGQFAFEMLRSGRCMLRQCQDHLHYTGPKFTNKNCLKCFREQAAK